MMVEKEGMWRFMLIPISMFSVICVGDVIFLTQTRVSTDVFTVARLCELRIFSGALKLKPLGSGKA